MTLMLFKKRKLKPADRTVFLRQLAMLCDNGFSLAQAVGQLAQNNESPAVKAYCRYLAESQDVRDGGGHEAPLLQGTIIAKLSDKAETPELFAQALNELADVNETTAHYGSCLASVLFYPVIILGVSVVVCAILLIFVIPVFEEMFNDFGSSLPGPTLQVLAISQWLKHYYYLLILSFLAIYWGGKLLPEIRLPFILLIPGLARVVKNVTAIHFSHLFAALLKFGFSVPEAFQIAVQSLAPTLYGRRLKRLTETIRDLSSFKAAIKDSAIFPVSTLALMDVVEDPGKLPEIYAGLSKYLRKNFDDQQGKTFRLIEVMAIIFVGFIVGGLVISMYLPIFKMAGAVGS